MLEEVTQGPRVVGAEGGPLILEVGCGSGAISLSLLSRLPQVSPLCMGRLTGTCCPCCWSFPRLSLSEHLGGNNGK